MKKKDTRRDRSQRWGKAKGKIYNNNNAGEEEEDDTILQGSRSSRRASGGLTTYASSDVEN